MKATVRPDPLSQPLLRIQGKTSEATRIAVYEHPWVVRITHWTSAVAITVMILSGLEIFRAFPSFGAKIPQHDLMKVPSFLGLGGWLGGALQWHLTFLWPLVTAGAGYAVYQAFSGNYRQVLFTPRDIAGVWPMARHYFLLGPKPILAESYNPLQKLAYTSTLFFGVLAVITGFALYKPVQLSVVVWLLGGFAWVRIWHFTAMLGFLSFIPGHLVMVVIHGWSNFYSMLVGWKKDPEHIALEEPPEADAALPLLQPSPRTVFIAGATGYMGARLATELVRRGHRVSGLARNGSARRLPAGCIPVIGDALDRSTFELAVKSADTLVQLVGVAHPRPAKVREFVEIDLASCRQSVAAATAQGVHHIVYVSVAQPAPVMKSYLAVRAQCEKLLGESGMNFTVLRPWYVLGPGHRWPNLLRPFYWIAKHIPGLKPGAARLDLVTLEQMVAALVDAVEHPAEGSRILEVPDIQRF